MSHASEAAHIVLKLFRDRGAAAYFGEAVSQTDHARQTAAVAGSQGAPAALVVAALLHDVGHLLHAEGEDAADLGIDTRHEAAGAAWLTQWFGAAVCEPVRLHVAAKRYLCAVDADYAARLSAASRQSLALQGGAFTPEEAAAFAAQPYALDAVALRRWDDAGKCPGLVIPELDHYRGLLERCATATAPTA